jgi:hypothetical protein
MLPKRIPALVVAAVLGLAAAFIVTPSVAIAGTQTFTATADTYVRYDAQTSNFGTSVRWSTDGRKNSWRNALLRFNVTVPAGERVTSAKLRAFSETAATTTEYVDVYTTAGGWSETRVTWRNAPARQTWLSKTSGFASGRWVEWDVTAGVTGSEVNFKLETKAQKSLAFKSRESSDPALRPRLVVTTEPTSGGGGGGMTSVNDTAMTFSSGWFTDTACATCFQGDNHHQNTAGGTYSHTFTGNKVGVYSEKNSALGIMAISIDGGAEVLVDPYATTRQNNVLVWTSPVLTEGTHTIRVRNTGTKNAASANTYMVADRLDITSGASTPTPTNPDGTTAAATFGWGPVVSGDEFNYTGAPDPAKWDVYTPGHAGNGLRSPAQATVDGAKLVMTGTAEGTTAGMGAKFDRQKYGRWEVRAAGSGDDEYHLVSILWPDSENWPCDGEVDYAETIGDWNAINFFLHYGCSNSQVSATRTLDVSQFHNYALDWSPSGMIGYIDGVEWFRSTDPLHQPPGPMHQTLQLDWFPNSTANGAGEMRVDWVRVYAAAAA